ncbi:hypothetical protein I5L79_15270 [Hymenobacter sp. BT594]|uniref:CidA/LrgA family protein n=1 Tax=Hymenobacter guriensis TaxID=2793065 RepID=A0ABS0L4B1_9BACT|nr:hypothetical protein [Hymenobacter guriensis]
MFLPSLVVWVLAVYATIGNLPLGSGEVLGGISLAVLGLVGPLLRWKIKGQLYALSPPFVYLIFSVILPYCLGQLLSVISPHGFVLAAAQALHLAVAIVLPVVCGYFFLAPEKFSVPNLLRIKTYH